MKRHPLNAWPMGCRHTPGDINHKGECNSCLAADESLRTLRAEVKRKDAALASNAEAAPAPAFTDMEEARATINRMAARAAAALRPLRKGKQALIPSKS